MGRDLKDGDVLLSNHPCAGGSHLPDLTVITPVCSTCGISAHSSSPCLQGPATPAVFRLCPDDLPSLPQVFRKGITGPVFFVASRGHHADIGGITPGSMPPHSTSLQQEGAVFISFKLVTGGIFQEEGKGWSWLRGGA